MNTWKMKDALQRMEWEQTTKDKDRNFGCDYQMCIIIFNKAEPLHAMRN
jgi:hypothetical protein